MPGDVGGSEQYLVRQLLGLASQPAQFVPTLYCLPSFVDAHAELASLYPMVAATSAERVGHAGSSLNTRGSTDVLAMPTSCTMAAVRRRSSVAGRSS